MNVLVGCLAVPHLQFMFELILTDNEEIIQFPRVFLSAESSYLQVVLAMYR